MGGKTLFSLVSSAETNGSARRTLTLNCKQDPLGQCAAQAATPAGEAICPNILALCTAKFQGHFVTVEPKRSDRFAYFSLDLTLRLTQSMTHAVRPDSINLLFWRMITLVFLWISVTNCFSLHRTIKEISQLCGIACQEVQCCLWEKQCCEFWQYFPAIPQVRWVALSLSNNTFPKVCPQ